MEQHRNAATLDQRRKVKTTEYADRTRRVRESTPKVGQTVLMKQEKRNRFSTRNDHRPYRVISLKVTLLPW